MSNVDYNLDASLKAISEAIGNSLQACQPEPPKLLYHYTNAGGMLGILNSSRLWATNFRFLNDASEVTYGIELYEKVVKERLAESKNAVVSEFLGRTLNTANAFDSMFDCYIACFCENDDLLNQWRVYSGSGGGFAIGLASSAIIHRTNALNGPTQDFILRKVIYSEAQQKSLISEVIDTTAKALEEATTGLTMEEANGAIARCCGFVRANLAGYLICFKHPAFEVENEWRLCHVVHHDQQDHISFRDGPYGLTPYVCLDINPSSSIYNNRLPISRITHGPCSNPANAHYALAKLLRVQQFWFVEIDGSTLPVRVGP